MPDNSATSAWRAAKNERALARLRRSLPEIFPAPVLGHALRRPLIPPTPRLAIESYWRAHPVRADRLARALAARSGAPEGWAWRLGTEDGLAASFRAPPAPFREKAFARGPGHCCVCGQPAFRFGWHADLWGAGTPNRRATWHAACVIAWKLWCAPSDHVKPLRKLQGGRCGASGKRLLRSGEVDHATPLYRVWRDHRAAHWPDLLVFWGTPNLRVVNRAVHVEKNAVEARDRAEAASLAKLDPRASTASMSLPDAESVDG